MGQTKFLKVSCGRYMITTVATSNPREVRRWLGSIYDNYSRSNQVIVGLDCEWIPRSTLQVPETLQLCVGADCIVIQIKQLDESGSLWESGLTNFVADPTFVFSGVGIKGDITRLEKYFDLQFGGQFLDIKKAAERKGINRGDNFGLQWLAQQVGGLDFVKNQSIAMSDWDKLDLSYEQIAYAARDAFASCRVAEILSV